MMREILTINRRGKRVWVRIVMRWNIHITTEQEKNKRLVARLAELIMILLRQATTMSPDKNNQLLKGKLGEIY